MLQTASAQEHHPLADPSAAAVVLGSLNGPDAVAMLSEIGDWLDSLVGCRSIRPERALMLIFEFEGAAQKHLLAAEQAYFLAAPGMAEAAPLWRAVREYWRRLCDAYADCSNRLPQDAPLGLDADTRAAMLARLIRAGAEGIKWDHYRRGPYDPVAWLKLGRAFVAAQAASLLSRVVELVPLGKFTTVEHEYIRALALQCSSLENLSAAAVRVGDALIRALVPHMRLTDQVRPDNTFWVDPAHGGEPVRTARLPRSSATLRYFSAAAALGELQERLARGHGADLLPGELAADSRTPLALRGVAEHLARYWAAVPPLRQHRRHSVKGHLRVVGGLQRVHEQLRRAGAERDDLQEAWDLRDVSLGGLGARAETVSGEWVRIGGLLAMQPDGGTNWLVGVVRRFAREHDNRGAVGIETLSTLAHPVEVDNGWYRSEAILLDVPEPGAEVRVALQVAAFDEQVPLRFSQQGQLLRLDPVGPTRDGFDFDLGRYRVVG